MKLEIYYKIRRSSDGKFSAGGADPKFTRDGKSWNIGQLKSHFRLLQEYNNLDVYKNCELIEYESICRPAEFSSIPELVEYYKQDLVVKKLKGVS